jgi:uncharacterized protein
VKLAGEYQFNAPIEEVWRALLDPVVLAATMPGCEKLELVDGKYLGELNVKVGPVQGKFSGTIELQDVAELKGYTIKVDGRGGPGFVNATARVDLERAGAETKMVYSADANVGGRIASVGERLVEASAKAIIKQSLEALNATVKARAEASALAAAATPAAPTAPVPAPVPVAPVQIDQAKLATAVAKEVTKAMVPRAAIVAAIAVVLALVAWWLATR